MYFYVIFAFSAVKLFPIFQRLGSRLFEYFEVKNSPFPLSSFPIRVIRVIRG